MAARVGTAIVAIPVVLGVNYVGGWPFAITMALVALVGTYELFQMERRAGYSPFVLAGLAGSAALVVIPVFVDKPQAGWVGIIVATVVASGWYFLFPKSARSGRSATHELRGVDERQGMSVLNWCLTCLAPLFVGLLLGHLSVLRHYHRGAWWVFLALIVTWAYDTGAFLTGSYFGKRPFMSHISPRKTMEGLIGGLIASTVVGLVGVEVIGLYVWQALLLGLLGGAAAQLGDLLESMLKRQLGVKDSGMIFPGHGGLLDRTDSLLLVGPLVAYLALWYSYAT